MDIFGICNTVMQYDIPPVYDIEHMTYTEEFTVPYGTITERQLTEKNENWFAQEIHSES